MSYYKQGLITARFCGFEDLITKTFNHLYLEVLLTFKKNFIGFLNRKAVFDHTVPLKIGAIYSL